RGSSETSDETGYEPRFHGVLPDRPPRATFSGSVTPSAPAVPRSRINDEPGVWADARLVSLLRDQDQIRATRLRRPRQMALFPQKSEKSSRRAVVQPALSTGRENMGGRRSEEFILI